MPSTTPSPIHGKLEEIGWPEELDWHQFFSVTFDINGAEVNVNDDITLKRWLSALKLLMKVVKVS